MSTLFASLRAKLLLSFCAFTLITVSVLLASYWLNRQQEELNQATAKLNLIHLDILKVIKEEQDFFAYETIRTDFYATGNSKHLKRHQQLLRQLQTATSRLHHHASIDDLNIQQDIQQLEIQLQAYALIFQRLVEQTQLRGFKDYGLEGQMRHSAHQLEQLPSIHPIQLLTLRRHEKDYVIRKDTAYVEKLRSMCNQLHRQLVKANAQQEELRLLDDYQLTFLKLVAVERTIGYNAESGLRKQLRDRTNRMGALVETTVQKAASQRKEFYQHIGYIYVIAVLASVVLSFLLNLLVAYRIAKPISRLSYQMNEMVRSNFSERVTPITNENQDEIGELTRNFNAMAAQMEKYLQNIVQQAVELEEHNAELLAVNEKLSESENSLRKVNAVKDKLFSILSHDLKGPLNTLTGFLQMLQQYTDCFTKEEIKDFAANMDESVKRLLTLLDNLLQWSLSRAGNLSFSPVEINLVEIVESNAALLKHMALEKQIILTIDIGDGVMVKADKNMLDYILRNLLSNAIKFTHPGGQIVVESSQADLFAQISVKDSGIGIREEDVKKIFKADTHFSTPGTQKERGTGFGLLLCKEFVERNRGTIAIKSELGTGTTITFSLPLVVHAEAFAQPN